MNRDSILFLYKNLKYKKELISGSKIIVSFKTMCSRNLIIFFNLDSYFWFGDADILDSVALDLYCKFRNSKSLEIKKLIIEFIKNNLVDAEVRKIILKHLNGK